VVLISSAVALFSLLFAPQQGLLFRRIRVFAFRRKTIEENLLKTLWKRGTPQAQGLFSLYFRWVFRRMIHKGWLEKKQGLISLTVDGEKKAISIVRLHRLWELYLSQALGKNLTSTAERKRRRDGAYLNSRYGTKIDRFLRRSQTRSPQPTHS
jgi:manganese/zinc/iron transport system permease protein